MVPRIVPPTIVRTGPPRQRRPHTRGDRPPEATPGWPRAPRDRVFLVYLDRVDVFWEQIKNRPSARDDMIGFFAELAATARTAKPGFIVMAPNAEDLLGDRRHRDIVDGLGKEDLFPLSREAVAKMKRKPDGGHRIVIAYLSIGESEDNRYYWPAEWNKSCPAWMKGESKKWKGNYLVEYWQPAWQKIIFGSPNSYVDRILAAGFDGFYIDRADAYYRFGDTPQTRDRMNDFLVRLIADIRSKKPDAAIMMQNTEELLERPMIGEAIDAIAKEDLLFGIVRS